MLSSWGLGWSCGCRRGGRPEGVLGLLQGSSAGHEQGGPNQEFQPASRDERLSPPRAFMLANVSFCCRVHALFRAPGRLTCLETPGGSSRRH